MQVKIAIVLVTAALGFIYVTFQIKPALLLVCSFRLFQ